MQITTYFLIYLVYVSFAIIVCWNNSKQNGPNNKTKPLIIIFIFIYNNHHILGF